MQNAKNVDSSKAACLNETLLKATHERGAIGLIGLAVMGQNLALNFADHGFNVNVFNRTAEKTTKFLDEKAHKNITGHMTIADFCSSLDVAGGRKRIIIMVKAGKIVDDQIEKLLPFLHAGDLLIDAGNSHEADTQRRMKFLADKGVYFAGAGVSGGEEGARNGPSVMLGAPVEVKQEVLDLFQPIAATDFAQQKCCSYLGSGGAGHFVKTIHNGIEYGDMQLIAETFDFLRRGLKLGLDEIASIFQVWDQGPLGGYLNEITAEIIRHETKEHGRTVDTILDVAAHKGTGRWSCEAALAQGHSLSLVYEALATRMVSSQLELRKSLSKRYTNDFLENTSYEESLGKVQSALSVTSKEEALKALENALWSSRLISYTQGFDLIRSYLLEHNEVFKGEEIARIWSGGCIIRSKLLENIYQAYQNNPSVSHLLESENLKQQLDCRLDDWQKIVCCFMQLGLPAGAFSTSLNYFRSVSCALLPTYLIQAQRDYFGAHTYERRDRERGEKFHMQWQSQSAQ